MVRGETITVSAIGCSYFPLTSIDVIKNFLINTVKLLGMTPVDDTLTIRTFPTLDGRGDYGISGFLILTESHISVHTWPQEKFIRVEFSSCKPQDESEKIIESCIEATFIPDSMKTMKLRW